MPGCRVAPSARARPAHRRASPAALIALLLLTGCPGAGEMPSTDGGAADAAGVDAPVGRLGAGAPCTRDGDCRSGICLDLARHDPACKGRLCTGDCGRTADCSGLINAPTCVTVDGRGVCFYGEWRPTRCKR